MAKTEKDEFGDRMKLFELQETGRQFMRLLPIYARIDGKCFSKFTRGMKRPYDVDMSRCMIETTKYLVKETGARIGYCQSDEISLIWYSDSYDSQVFFNGRVFKMTSVLAAMATSAFTLEGLKAFPDRVQRMRPVFDCRIFQLPNLVEASNALLWREMDATKNAVSMAARSMFSHKELDGQGRADMHEMMFQKGHNFNDYPAFFKRGTFVQRKQVLRTLTDDEIKRIPPDRVPTGPVLRHEIVELDMPSFRTVKNRVGVIFDGEPPITGE